MSRADRAFVALLFVLWAFAVALVFASQAKARGDNFCDVTMRPRPPVLLTNPAIGQPASDKGVS